MKFRITMKDPDGVWESIDEEAREHAKSISGLSKSERDCVMEDRRECLWSEIEEWIQYREYVTIEIDTEKRTATVLKAGAQ